MSTEDVDEYHDQPVRRPGSGSLSRPEARRDVYTRRWDVVSPSATQIGRPADPTQDVSDRMRRLHEERHPAMQGHSERAHHLDKLRVAHALCNHVDLTPWQRDRVLGLVEEIDLTAFGSRRSVPIVALVTIRYVVDRERRAYLGLDDEERIRDLAPEAMAALYEQFESLADDPGFEFLLDQHGLDTTSLNRLERILTEQIEERDLEGAAYGREANRDPNLPAFVGGERPADGE